MRPLSQGCGHILPATLALAPRRAPLDAAGEPDQLTHGAEITAARSLLQLPHEAVDVPRTRGLVLTAHGRIRQRLARLGLRGAGKPSNLSETETTRMLAQ